MHILLKIIFTPLKLCWYILNFIRECILNIFAITICIALVVIFFQSYYPNTQNLKQKALVMNISGKIIDNFTQNKNFKPFKLNFFNISKNQFQENSLFYIVEIIRQAKNDPTITGLILSLKNFSGADQSSLQYLGKVLREFRSSGKKIFAIGNNYTQSQYFLASYADKIYLTPSGNVDLHGMSTSAFYYKSFLDKLKIHSHVFRVGRYKSAVEPFIRNNASDEARKMDSLWLNKLWDNYLETVSTNRHTTKQTIFPDIQIYIKKLKDADGNLARFALGNKWIDIIASHNEIEKDMIKFFGFNKKNQSFNSISMYDYSVLDQKQCNNKIAVIFVEGIISDEVDSSKLVNSYNIVNQIRNARLDPKVKAIILRVNSPGGSVEYSELIRTELMSVRASGKPLIVSMGGVAASGGYLISTPANVIIASNNTLTGSIGIFGIINTFEDTLDKIGVHSDGVSTSILASGMSATQKFPIELEKITQMNIDYGYKNFINIVAQSRHKTIEEIEKISQGRVWIGNNALSNGLVDILGDFDDAVKQAVYLAKIKDYQLYWYKHNKFNLIDAIISNLHIFTYTTIKMLSYSFFPEPILNKITNLLDFQENNKLYLHDPRNCYAYCLFCSYI